jgi:hypothetical protein
MYAKYPSHDAKGPYFFARVYGLQEPDPKRGFGSTNTRPRGLCFRQPTTFSALCSDRGEDSNEANGDRSPQRHIIRRGGGAGLKDRKVKASTT